MNVDLQNQKWSLKRPLFLDKKDKRYAKQQKQLKTRGFSDSETWNLDSVISAFVLPRLRRFKEVNICHPIGMTAGEFDGILDKMIFAHEWSLEHDDEKYEKLTQKEQDANWAKYDEGIKLFSKYYRDLWW